MQPRYPDSAWTGGFANLSYLRGAGR